MTVTESLFAPSQVADSRPALDIKLIRAGLLMLLFMTTAFGAATWNAVQDLATHMKLIPVGLFVVVCVLVVRLYAKVDDIAAAQRTPAAARQSDSLEIPAASVAASDGIRAGQVPLRICNEIWKYWDTNGTGRQSIEYIGRKYDMPSNVVQQILEGYDVRWRKQLATLYSDNPRNEYMAYLGIEEHQVAEDARRIKSGLPIYPAADVWLCSSCGKRPCRCERAS